MKKIIYGLIIILVIIIFIAFMVYYGLNKTGAGQSQQGNLPAVGQVQPVVKSDGEPITVSGWIICVPPKGDATNCVIGIQDAIQDTQANIYALLDANSQLVDPTNYTTGRKTIVSGYLIKNSEIKKTYDVSGAIQLGN